MKGINDKAKKYADNQLCSLDKYTEWNNPFSKLDVEIAYKDGYAQGQKDSDTFKSFKNGYEHSALECAKDIKVLTKENAELKEQLDSAQKALLVINKKNEKLAMWNCEYKAQIEKMKCCGNCGNTRCTSKYRGNSAYHTQSDGYACADNEDWTPRQR